MKSTHLLFLIQFSVTWLYGFLNQKYMFSVMVTLFVKFLSKMFVPSLCEIAITDKQFLYCVLLKQ